MKKIIPMTYDVMLKVFNNEKNISLLEEFIAFYMDIPLKEVKGNLKLLKRNLDKNNLKSSKKVLSKKNASKLVDEVIRLSGDDEVMIEFDMNSKRDLELKSEYDEMVSMFKEKEEKLKEQLKKREENLNKQLKEQLDKQLKEQLDKQLKEQLKHQKTILKEKEHNKQIEIAKNLLKNNVDINIITSSTGLSKEEINKIKV